MLLLFSSFALLYHKSRWQQLCVHGNKKKFLNIITPKSSVIDIKIQWPIVNIPLNQPNASQIIPKHTNILCRSSQVNALSYRCYLTFIRCHLFMLFADNLHLWSLATFLSQDFTIFRVNRRINFYIHM